jgi:hypothetical protein
MNIPAEVIDWIRKAFRGCNTQISEKLSNIPNIHEESLDFSWIEYFSRLSSPVTLSSGWTVKIETHYLGGLRHHMNWEIADIGILLFIRQGGKITRSKVALLQSKRLYPTNNRVRNEGIVDYEIGFARLADSEDLMTSIATQAEYEFNEDCQYGALVGGSDQVRSIQDYQKGNDVSVYYQFYNPWTVPFLQRIPLSDYSTPDIPFDLGVRILSSNDVHSLLSSNQAGYRPSLAELRSIGPSGNDPGWALEYFAADLFLQCHEGTTFESIQDNKIQNLFYRRSGPIAAAIAINVEAPE